MSQVDRRRPKFLTPLSWNQIGMQKYVLCDPLKYESAILMKVIEVPEKFVTDGESCPRWLPIVNSLFGDVADMPAVIHDWLYYTADYERIVADKVLLEAMGTIKDLPYWRRLGIYYGLRIGGWVAWDEHRKKGHSYEQFYRRRKDDR